MPTLTNENMMILLKNQQDAIINFIEMNTRVINSRLDDVIRDIQKLKTSARFNEGYISETLGTLVDQIQMIKKEKGDIRRAGLSLSVDRDRDDPWDEVEEDQQNAIKQKSIEMEKRRR